MAPSLIGVDSRFHPEGEEPEDYDKILHVMPKNSSSVQVGEFYHVSKAADLYRLKEFNVAGADYPNYIIGELLQSIDEVYQAAEVGRLRKARETPQSIATQIEALKLHVGQPVTTVFRTAYCDFAFVDKGGKQAICKQIRGVYSHHDHQAAGLATTAYSYLVDKYSYLACDYNQTILGATLWAISMRRRGLVEIYDTTSGQFIEELGDDALGVNGYVPWDIGSLPPYRRPEWLGPTLNMIPRSCQHIINIVSRHPPLPV